MKLKTKLYMVSLPVLMTIAQASYATDCATPCVVSGSNGAQINVNDTGFLNNGPDFQLRNVYESNTNARFYIGSGKESFIVEDDAPAKTLVVDDVGRVGVGTQAPAEQFEIFGTTPGIKINKNGGGHANLKEVNATVGGLTQHYFIIQGENNRSRLSMQTNGAPTVSQDQIYMDADGDVGLGIFEPTHALHVKNDGSDYIVFDGATQDWSWYAENSYTALVNHTTNDHTLRIYNDNSGDDSLVLRSNNVGIGTLSPTASLHVKESNANLVVEDTNAASPSAVLIDLKKSGIPAFRLTNSANGSSWDFTQRTNNNFTLSKAGSGGFEMQITPTGDVFARGDVYAQGIMLTSSRSAKTDFAEIKTSDVMKKLAEINVEEWSYKGKKDRHISPMAEDFYSLFQLGPDNKHINPNDLASVAIIAAKELQAKAITLKTETEALKTENTGLKMQLKEQALAMKAKNDALQERMASLEKLVSNLASGEGYLSNNAKKVALNQ